MIVKCGNNKDFYRLPDGGYVAEQIDKHLPLTAVGRDR